jgi:putative resolvase
MNTSKIYVSSAHIREQFDVSESTLRRWADLQTVRSIRVGTSDAPRRLYHADDIRRMFHQESSSSATTMQRAIILYARVSSEHQRGDLERQVQQLEEYAKTINAENAKIETIQDVGSGLNYHRKGFTTLLEHIYQGSVATVVVTYSDRLARFGLELVEWICEKHDTKIMVLGHTQDAKDDGEHELRDDLLAVTTFFVARNNGRRSTENRKRRKAAGQNGTVGSGERKSTQNHQNNKRAGEHSEKDSTQSNKRAGSAVEEVDGHESMDL